MSKTNKESKVKTVFTADDRMTQTLDKIRKRLDSTFGGVARRIRADADALRKVSTTVFRLGQIGFQAGRGILEWSNSITDGLDVIAKTSRRAGISSKSFQELKFAAGLSGASATEFADAMEKFGISMGRLQAGKGELVEFLRVVSPTMLETLKGAQSNEAALNSVFEGLSRLQDPSKRAAFAVAAFGESGRKLALMVEGGMPGLEKMRKRLRDLGLTIGDDALSNSEAFNDELSVTMQTWEAAKSRIGVAIAEAALPRLQELNEWLVKNNKSFGEFLDDVGAGIVKAADAIAKAVDKLVEAGKWFVANADTFATIGSVLGVSWVASLLGGGRGGPVKSPVGVPPVVTPGGTPSGPKVPGAKPPPLPGEKVPSAPTSPAGPMSRGKQFLKTLFGPIGLGMLLGEGMATALGVPDRSPEEVTAIRKREAASSIQTGGGGKTLAEIRAERRAAGMAGMREALQAVNTIQNLPAAVQAQQQAAKVVIDFLNAPAGMSVRQIDAPKGTDVSVVQRRGTRTLGTGEGL